MAKKKATAAKPRRTQAEIDKRNYKCSDAELIAALDKSRGLVAVAARSLGMSPRALHYRIASTPEIAEARETAREELKDFAEGKLFQQIDKGEAWAICFFLKTQARDRGYVEKSEIEHTGGQALLHLRPADALKALEDDPRFIEFARAIHADSVPGLFRGGVVVGEVEDGAAPAVDRSSIDRHGTRKESPVVDNRSAAPPREKRANK